GEVLIVDDIAADQQTAADVIAEISAARARPPAPDRALATMPDHHQVRFHLLGVGGDLPCRLTDGQLAPGLEAERREPRHALLQHALVFVPLLGDATAADTLAELGARRLPDDREHEHLRSIP